MRKNRAGIQEEKKQERTPEQRKEQIPCDICGSHEYTKKFEKDGFTVVRCNSCGLNYVNPRLKKEVLNEMYNKNEVSPVPYYKETEKEDKKTFQKRMKLLCRYIKNDRPKVLDVGCNIGTFMTEMKKAGWEVMGIDLNKSSIEHCKSIGHKAVCSGFEEAKLPEGEFDLIIMNDFIEHVHSPTQSIKKAHRLLKDGGMLFISTPDIGSGVARMSGKSWVHMKPDEHIYFFSRITMKKMLEKEGLKVIWNKSVGRVRSLRVVMIKTQAYTKLIWKIIQMLKLEKPLSKIAININPGDEMGVIAQK